MTLLVPSTSADQRVVLRDVSWQTYLTLLSEVEGQHLFLTYDRGILEIMSPSPKHAKIGKFIARLVETFTLELRIPIVGLGTTTWKSEAVLKGLEADECYYVQRAAWAAEREVFDLPADPPPDLAIEVDVSGSTVDKEAIYATLGVPELWRWDDERLAVLKLVEDHYVRTDRSICLPLLSLDVVADYVRRRTTADDTTLMLEFREWVRQDVMPRP
jgi:Uma2 family endonuclease